MTAIIIIVTILSLLLIIFISRLSSKKKHIEKEYDDEYDDDDDENTEYTKCSACRGIGGHYVNSNDDDDAEYEECEKCDGYGEIPNKRISEQELDSCENETKQWMNCKNCDACGYIYTEKDQMVACPICDGYGVVEDTRTPEEKEVDKIAAEKKALQEKLKHFIEDNELDFYGEKKRKEEIELFKTRLNHFNSELNSISNYINDLKETTKATNNAEQKQLEVLHEISKDIWKLILLVLFLFFYQCSNNDKICDKISNLRDDISDIEYDIKHKNH